MISSRAIALQGVGFAVAVLAVQGFANVQQTQVTPRVGTNQSSGGAYYDTGRAVVKKDRGWVRATKYGIVGGRPLVVSSSAFGRADVGKVKLSGAAYTVNQSSSAETAVSCTSTLAVAYTQSVNSSATAGSETPVFDARTNSVSADWLSADELLSILENLT